MNKDIVEGKWKQMQGEAKAWWGKLTDNDLERAAGKFEVLAGILQEKYGYSREQAANEIESDMIEIAPKRTRIRLRKRFITFPQKRIEN